MEGTVQPLIAPHDMATTAQRTTSPGPDVRASTRPRNQPVRYGTSGFEDDGMEYTEALFSDPCATNPPARVSHDEQTVARGDDALDFNIRPPGATPTLLPSPIDQPRDGNHRPKLAEHCGSCNSPLILLSSGATRCKCSYRDLLQHENVGTNTVLEIIEESTTENEDISYRGTNPFDTQPPSGSEACDPMEGAAYPMPAKMAWDNFEKSPTHNPIGQHPVNKVAANPEDVKEWHLVRELIERQTEVMTEQAAKVAEQAAKVTKFEIFMNQSQKKNRCEVNQLKDMLLASQEEHASNINRLAKLLTPSQEDRTARAGPAGSQHRMPKTPAKGSSRQTPTYLRSPRTRSSRAKTLLRYNSSSSSEDEGDFRAITRSHPEVNKLGDEGTSLHKMRANPKIPPPPIYSGGSAELYQFIDEFKKYCNMFGITGSKAASLMKQYMKDEANEALTAWGDEETQTVEDIIIKLKERFCSPSQMIAAQGALRADKQGPNENIDTFIKRFSMNVKPLQLPCDQKIQIFCSVLRPELSAHLISMDPFPTTLEKTYALARARASALKSVEDAKATQSIELIKQVLKIHKEEDSLDLNAYSAWSNEAPNNSLEKFTGAGGTIVNSRNSRGRGVRPQYQDNTRPS